MSFRLKYGSLTDIEPERGLAATYCGRVPAATRAAREQAPLCHLALGCSTTSSLQSTWAIGELRRYFTLLTPPVYNCILTTSQRRRRKTHCRHVLLSERTISSTIDFDNRAPRRSSNSTTTRIFRPTTSTPVNSDYTAFTIDTLTVHARHWTLAIAPRAIKAFSASDRQYASDARAT